MKASAKFIGLLLNAFTYLFPKAGGKLSFYLFCIPFKARLKSRHLDFLSTARQGFADSNGIPVAHYTWGSGSEKILLVHGWRSNSYRWKGLIQTLDHDRYTLVSFDAPGHGRSGSLISNVLLYEMAIASIQEKHGPFDAIIGHSIGSFASAYYLSRQNTSIAKYVSLAPPRAAIDFVDYYQDLAGLTDKTRQATLRHFKSYTGHPPEYFEIAKFCPHIKMPSLLIHDKQDRDTPFTTSVNMNDILENSELVLTQDLGHKLTNQEVQDKIAEFLR